MANALQAIKTASALSTVADTTLFMPGLETSKPNLKQYYDISESPLQLQSMYLDRINKITFSIASKIKNSYEYLLSLYLRHHPKWSNFHGQKVLFVRARNEFLYWGLKRENSNWLKDWTFIFEAHDALGFDPVECEGRNPFELKSGTEGHYRQMFLKALHNFDHIICLSQALANDISSWSNHTIQPQVVNQASSIPRVSNPPPVSFSKNIVLGYIGTIDQLRGVNILLEAVNYLPQNYKLRIVGKFRQEEGVASNWFDNYMNNPLFKSRVDYIPAVPIKDVYCEIDRCDILLQPATNNSEYFRYASPLKAFDPMMRGKPIIAADTPGLRDLYENGKIASFYRIDPRSLAECITNLVNHPDQAEKIAHAGWEKSVEYTYSRRAEKIISIVNN